MPKPYAYLRAQMAPDAQRLAADKARALLAVLVPHASGGRMPLARENGWWPWRAQEARDFDHTPYAHRQVEIAREEWNGSQIVEPRTLHPLMNVVDLWWRPVNDDA